MSLQLVENISDFITPSESVKLVQPSSFSAIQSDFLQKTSNELKLICLLVRFPFNQEQQQQCLSFIAQNVIDWRTVKKIALKNRINLICYQRLVRLSIPEISLQILLEMKKYGEHQLRHNLLNAQRLLTLYKAAVKENLTIIPYKGAVFALDVYGNLDSRSFSDIDFWFPNHQSNAFKKLLIKQGCKQDIPYSKWQEFFFKKISCEYHYVQYFYGNRFLIEPHFWLHNHFLQKKPTKQDLEKYTHHITFLNQSIKIFSPEFTLVYLALHHGAHECWGTLKFNLDLAAFVNRYHDKIDWLEALELCKRYEVRKILLVGMQSIKNLFNSILPPLVQSAIDQSDIQSVADQVLGKIISLDKPAPNTTYKMRFFWKTRETGFQKIKFIKRLISYSFLRFLFYLSMK